MELEDDTAGADRPGSRIPDGREPSTRDKLLLAAKTVFTERGWALSTVDEIVKLAGVSRGSFYVYFDNKRDVFERLWLGVLDDLYERAAARRPGDTIFARLESGNRAFLEVWERETGLMRTVMEALDDPGIRAMLNAMRLRFIERTTQALARHREQGITHDIDPALAGAALAGMVDTMAYRYFVFGEPPGVELDVPRLSYALTSLWYRAIYGEQAPPIPPEEEHLAWVAEQRAEEEASARHVLAERAG